MIHKMNLQNAPFCKIKEGSKDIEMRLYDEKRKQIQEGDFIEFTNAKNEEKLIVKVIKLHRFSSFKEIYNSFNKIRLGYNENEISKPEDMEQYYLKEEIKKNGVVGIEIELV